MDKKLHPKIEKNIYDLNHDRYLQKSHTIANLGMASFIAFLGGIATYIIEGEHEFTQNIFLFALFGSCLIIVFFYINYRRSKRKKIKRRV